MAVNSIITTSRRDYTVYSDNRLRHRRSGYLDVVIILFTAIIAYVIDGLGTRLLFGFTDETRCHQSGPKDQEHRCS